MSHTFRERVARRDQLLERHIPYAAHLNEHVIRTRLGDYVQFFRLQGASFETADDDQLNNWHERLNTLWRNIASENVVIWTHTVRRREQMPQRLPVMSGFAARLAGRYHRRLGTETLMVNELYVSILYRPTVPGATRILSRTISHSDQVEARRVLADSIDACSKLSQTLLNALDRYEPQQLGIYKDRGRYYSEPLEFLGVLINGEHQKMPVPTAPLNEVLGTTRPLFGFESLEYRMPTQSRLGAMLGIVEYSSPTIVGALDALLSTPFPWILTQSFAFLRKVTAQGLLTRQYNRMKASGDFGVSQADQLHDALDELTSNEWVMGDHHLSLQVLTDPIDSSDGTAQACQLRTLNDRVAKARAILADCTGMVIGREDLALEAAYWAQLPGNFAFRPRKAPISSRNFAAFAAFHNYPTGSATGNHWGNALTVFATASGSPYFFSYHACDPEDPDGGTKKDIGHTLIIGPTGSGKTALISFTLCELQSFGVTSVLFTKDRDTEIVIRALGGKYYAIKSGVPTGWNPFQLEPTPGHIQFLNELVRKLVWRPEHPLTITDENDLSEAIRSVMSFDHENRRLGRVLDYLDATRAEGVYVRLKQWCYARRAGQEDGSYAWIFDNAEDTLIDALGSALTTGFDVTEFLDKPTIRTPINMYLFHLIEQLVDGRRFALFVAEFWKALDDEYFGNFAKNQLKTIRKNNGFVVLDSQSPSDAINHRHSRTLIEQTPTKILFPNPEANLKDYTSDEGLNLTQREYRLIKQDIATGSRLFLVRQGHNSVVARLDLKGFEPELAVLSARKKNIDFMHELIARHGERTDGWLQPFLDHFETNDRHI